MRRRGGRLYKIEAEFEKENAVLIYMSNEIEEKPLPRASRCRNVTCIGGKECRGGKRKVKELSPHKDTSATSSWAAHLIIK
jgi:hypothetical protein